MKLPDDFDRRVRGAVLGCAAGDALGWPQEVSSRNMGRRSTVEPSLVFRGWRRLSGTQWARYEEEIAPGAYSDDTQLMLCVARSRLRAADWYDFLTQHELPTWLLYERGGGAAVKAAARAWQAGGMPWDVKGRSRENDVARYFKSGANGVAMRILPHTILGAADEFGDVARYVLVDGFTTHGHPRATVGALVHAYAIWTALRTTSTLRYGELIDAARQSLRQWPELAAFTPPGWQRSFTSVHGDPLDVVWQETLSEVEDLLQVVRAALDSGAAVSDRQVLADLGCTDRKSNGSGTITAVAALYLASRFAAEPTSALRAAAFLHGGDTDTLASMTASLLGALLGPDWLGDLAVSVEDASYLRHLAASLTNPDLSATPGRGRRVTKARIDRVSARLDKGDTEVALPDGRTAMVQQTAELAARTDNLRVRQWRLAANDGQSLYVTRVSRGPVGVGQPEPEPGPHRAPPGGFAVGTSLLRINLPVRNLEASARFYETLCEWPVSEATSTEIRFAGSLGLTFTPQTEGRAEPRTTLTFEVTDIETTHRRLREAGYKVRGIRRDAYVAYFQCHDPDGFRVEVRTSPPLESRSEGSISEKLQSLASAPPTERLF